MGPRVEPSGFTAYVFTAARQYGPHEEGTRLITTVTDIGLADICTASMVLFPKEPCQVWNANYWGQDDDDDGKHVRSCCLTHVDPFQQETLLWSLTTALNLFDG